MIKVDVFNDGKLVIYNGTVSDSIRHETIKFNFPSGWDGYTKTAIFKNFDKTINVVLNCDNDLCVGVDECYVPHEVIKTPEFTVSVFGTKENSRITTSKVRVKVSQSGYEAGDVPSEPTLEVYEQLVGLANKTLELAQSVRNDADNGKFKGDKGEQGIRGEKGDIGERGPQGIQGVKGEKGDNGVNGKDGYTPQKGVDYFTDEDIAGLNIPSVDQTYSPNSENAQSGKAVAEAINNNTATNLRNGSSIGSTRSIGSTKEDSSYKLGKYSMAEGLGTQSGAKAFTIVGVDKTNKTYTLDSVEGLAVGDVYSAHVLYTNENSSQAENYGKITAIDMNRNVVTVDNLWCEGDFLVDISPYVSDIDGELNTFRIINKPNIGTRIISDMSHAEGAFTKALSKGSHAEGRRTIAYGSWSHAEGGYTQAGYSAHAEGGNTEASGYYSHAEGTDNTNAVGYGSHAEGYNTQASGGHSHTEGGKTNSIGDYSHAEGVVTTALGYGSHAEGGNTEASSNYSHAEGVNTTALGYGSHAEGRGTIASNDYSHAEGTDNTNAVGYGSHAEGYNTQASGNYSHTEGGKTEASGDYSHAEGVDTNALGYGSHAEGHGTITLGSYSHAEGYFTSASGVHSHAEGCNTKASSKYQHVQGKYNIADTANTYADIIGNGESDENRSNAATVDWNGNAWYSGEVYVGSTSGTNKDEGSKKLATEEYVDEEIANFDFIKIVTELPETGLVNRTYFVPKQDPNTNDLYDEYMWVDNKWELITTKQIEVDLTEYVKNTDINQSYDPLSENAQSGKAVAEAVNTFFSDNNMELIKEITLAEDVGEVDILTKDEGIELRDTFIYCSFLATERGYKTISLRKDGGASYYGYGLDIGDYTENHITNGTPRVFGHFIYPIGETGRVLTLGLKGTQDGNVDLATGISQGLMMHSSTLSYTYTFSSQKIDNLNMFLVGRTETNLIKAGSKIWLFGRRVK